MHAGSRVVAAAAASGRIHFSRLLPPGSARVSRAGDDVSSSRTFLWAGRELAVIKAKNARLIADAINRREVLIGMTANQCLKSWGPPERINRTVTAGATREQWRYGDKRYLYIQDGAFKKNH